MIKRFAIGLALSTGCAGAQTWEMLPSLPTGGAAKASGVGATLNGRIYVLGGTPWTSGGDGTVYSMPLGGSVWTEELSFDGIGPVISQGGGIDALGRILIFGGEDTENPGDSGKTFDWDPQEGPWHNFALRSASAPLRNFAYATDDAGRVYSIGGGPGEWATSSAPNSTRVERYLPSTNQWQVLSPLPVPCGAAAAVNDGLGHILVIGGVSQTGASRLTEVQQFDVASGTWSTTAVPDLPIAVSEARAVRDANGKIHLIGGLSGPMRGGATRREVLVFDPTTQAWSSGPSLSVPRRDFAAVAGADEYIYVMGGDNDSGGTNTAERIRPSACPVFNTHPTSTTIWRGSLLVFQTQVVGDGDISLQWERDAQPLAEGPTPHGSIISGAQATTLTITNIQPEDGGIYRLVAVNACGSRVSHEAVVTVRTQVPLPNTWSVTVLHPSYAESSVAYDVEGDIQVGAAVYDTPEYTSISHPTIWHGSAGSAWDVTPPDSQGGAILSISGDALVGWWWRPFQCYVNGHWVTCYYQRASTWNPAGMHSYPTESGWEYHSMADTDGAWHVGSVTTDDASGNFYTHAYVWRGPTFSPLDLHPGSVASKSGLTAIDGSHQFGWIHTPFPGPVQHAAMWTGTPSSFVDLQPVGASRSSIAAAGDGQQVGFAQIGETNVAGLWSGSPASFMSLQPTGANSASVNGCAEGLQVGAVDGSAYLWAGSPDEGFDLGALTGSSFLASNAYGIDVAPDGTISVVGSAFSAATGRSQAILWRSVQTCSPADMAPPFGVLDFFDVSAYLAAFSSHLPSADLNHDQTWDFFDVAAFLAYFSAGCP